MKTFLGRVLGYQDRIENLRRQQDETAESLAAAARASNIHSRRAARLVELLEAQGEVQHQAATLIRQAHRQMNLKGGVAGAQQKILEAARLLEDRG